MGLIVGSNYYFVACDDPAGRGCHAKLPHCGTIKIAQDMAYLLGWGNGANNGKWWCKRCGGMTKTIILKKDTWWTDLGQSKLPLQLVDMLRELVRSKIGSEFSKSIGPTATKHLISLAKTYLTGGVKIEDILYDLYVYVPDSPDTYRFVFILIPSYPTNGELKRIDRMD